MLDRRLLLRGLLAAALTVPTWSARGQQPPRMPRVGVLYYGARSNNLTATAGLPLFRKRLHELGYIEGRSVLIEDHYADGNAQRLDELARQLVQSRVDVIVASAIAAASAAHRATTTIPIVMVHAGNPIGAGLIASLARPGGNVTGTSNLPLGAKQLELIRSLVPQIASVAVIVNPTNAGVAPILAGITDAARGFGIGVDVVDVSRTEDFPRAFAALRSAHPDALMVLVEPLIGAYGKQIVEFAAMARLPAIYDFGNMVRMGGLISYAPVFLDHYTLAADYVDKILKGANPTDLPVQQPDKFELLINLKTARVLGLTVPQSLLLRADEVIQ